MGAQNTGRGITRNIFENHLFDAHTLAGDLVRKSRQCSQDKLREIEAFRATLRRTFNGIDTWGKVETNVSTRIIAPLLRFLGWNFSQESSYTVQGIRFRPDFILFRDEDAANTLSAPQLEIAELVKGATAFLEAKAADKTLDTGKPKREENPYVQLLAYLTYARIDRGFLCNGREIWLVDASELSSSKRYIKVDLMALAERGTIQDWQLFCLLFGKEIHTEALESGENLKDSSRTQSYEKDADQGNSAARKNPFVHHEDELQVKKDCVKEYELSEKTAVQGETSEQSKLGLMYQHGDGVQQDYVKARECYEKAAAQGDALAQNNLGFLYQEGLGVQQDYTRAREWYAKAAAQGDASAQSNLAFLYEGGLGCRKNSASIRSGGSPEAPFSRPRRWSILTPYATGAA